MAVTKDMVAVIIDAFDMRQVAEAEKIDVARIMLDAVRKERDRQRELIERMPKINTEIVSETTAVSANSARLGFTGTLRIK